VLARLDHKEALGLLVPQVLKAHLDLQDQLDNKVLRQQLQVPQALLEPVLLAQLDNKVSLVTVVPLAILGPLVIWVQLAQLVNQDPQEI
jgi:hypothetical protein